MVATILEYERVTAPRQAVIARHLIGFMSGSTSCVEMRS